MQFVKLGEFYAAAHTSGVTHNFLKIRLSESGQNTMVCCERLPAMGGCRHNPVDAQALIRFVLEGVAQANQKLGTTYTVTHIQYVENDTPPASKYGDLATRIVERLHSGEAWTIGVP